MFPQMTDSQNRIMVAMQSKKPEELDPFERQMRTQAGRLSMQIDQLGSLVNNLKDKLEKAEKEQTTLVGEFQGVVMAVEAYHNAKAMGDDGKKKGCDEGKDADKQPDGETKDNVVPMKGKGGGNKKGKKLARKQKPATPPADQPEG